MKSSIAIILFTILGSTAYSQECNWSAVKNQTYSSSMKLVEIAKIRTVREEALACLAKNYFSNFLQHGVSIHYRNEIQDSLDQAIFLGDLKVQALEQTLAFFETSGSEVAHSFAQAIRKKLASDGIG